MIYLGIDQSKRSTGCVWLDPQGELLDYLLITPPKELDGVELIAYQWRELERSCRRQFGPPCSALIEGLSFAAVGSGKDLLAGLNWYVRTRLATELGIFCGTVPVTMWRNKVLSKENLRWARAEGKDGLKQAVKHKLPPEVRQDFLAYVEGRKEQILAAKGLGEGSSKYLESVYDLADAYFIAQHCRKLYIDK